MRIPSTTATVTMAGFLTVPLLLPAHGLAAATQPISGQASVGETQSAHKAAQAAHLSRAIQSALTPPPGFRLGPIDLSPGLSPSHPICNLDVRLPSAQVVSVTATKGDTVLVSTLLGLKNAGQATTYARRQADPGCPQLVRRASVPALPRGTVVTVSHLTALSDLPTVTAVVPVGDIVVLVAIAPVHQYGRVLNAQLRTAITRLRTAVLQPSS